ncbi:MAG: CheY-like chemotaxis protein [Cyclobacteriaceae bacterium]|jgi:CheY-like chemotaxis protein
MNPVRILLVEDNEGDIVLTIDAFEECKITTNISVVKNGGDAIDFLFKRGAFTGVERPDLILLDINIPVYSGHEVLQIIKEDVNLRRIPVIMLTTSSNEKDVHLAYQNHSNSFVTKPIDMTEFVRVILKIEEFWLQLVRLPN